MPRGSQISLVCCIHIEPSGILHDAGHHPGDGLKLGRVQASKNIRRADGLIDGGRVQRLTSSEAHEEMADICRPKSMEVEKEGGNGRRELS